MAHSQVALPGSSFEFILGPPTLSHNSSHGWSALSTSLADALSAAGLARQRLQFPWTWLARLEDLPLPSLMITSLRAGGVVYAIELAAMLGRNIPLAPRVRRDLEACCRRLGIEPGQPVPEWWLNNLEALEASFGGQVKLKVVEHVSWQLPMSIPQPPYLMPVKAARLSPSSTEPLWANAPVGLAVPAVQRPLVVLAPPRPIDPLVTFTVPRPGQVQLILTHPIALQADDRVWLWQAEEIEPNCYRITREEGAAWTVDGVASADRVFAASLDRGGLCLGSAFRAHSEIAVAILSSESWERTASWLRWCRVPVFDGVVQRSVARRVKAEPEATLAAWLAPTGPDGLAYSDALSSSELLHEFFANWWASADEADAMLRAAHLLGEDPGAWVRLAAAYPILLGQILAAGWRYKPARHRKILLGAVCDRLALDIVPDGQGGEAHWELAEQTALVRAAKEWGVGEWMFTSQGQVSALTDWANGKPVPPEIRRRWLSAWAGPRTCQWTALHIIRELHNAIGDQARGAAPNG